MPYFLHDGVNIHYEEHDSGDPVLLMPGFTESARDLSALIDALAAHYHIIAPDLRGYGRSTPQPRTYTPDFYTQDTEDMSALLRRLDTGPAHVIGFSDGGEVALLLAVMHSELVRSLVEWGAAGTLGDGAILPELDAIYNLVDAPREDMQGWREYIIRDYGEGVARRMVQGWAEASKAILARGGDLSLSRAHQIKCPALLISGENDPFATPQMTRQLAARIPNAEYSIVPNAGHAVHQEQPEWFVQRVVGFLKRKT